MLRALEQFERTLAGALLVVLFGLVGFQILSRYVLQVPFVWTEELARYTLIWLTFIAAGFVTGRDSHITVTVVDKILSDAALKWLVVLSRLTVGVAALVIMPGGWRLLDGLGAIDSPAAGISMRWVYGASLAGFGLVAIHSFASAVLVGTGRLPTTAPPEGVAEANHPEETG